LAEWLHLLIAVAAKGPLDMLKGQRPFFGAKFKSAKNAPDAVFGRQLKNPPKRTRRRFFVALEVGWSLLTAGVRLLVSKFPLLALKK
jgi:hypothetical protein